jgi:hypothetical protein
VDDDNTGYTLYRTGGDVVQTGKACKNVTARRSYASL